MRFMVRAREFRIAHADAHYAAAASRNQRELAVRLKDQSVSISLDDNHLIKVGKPGCPVTAAERGWRVLVGHDTTLEVKVTMISLEWISLPW